MPYYITYKDKKLDGEFDTLEEAIGNITIASTNSDNNVDDFGSFLLKYKNFTHTLSEILGNFVNEMKEIRPVLEKIRKRQKREEEKIRRQRGAEGIKIGGPDGASDEEFQEWLDDMFPDD